MACRRSSRANAGLHPNLFGDDDSASAPDAGRKRKGAPGDAVQLVGTDGAAAADGSAADDQPPPAKKKGKGVGADSTPGLCNLLSSRIFVLSA